MFFKRNPTHSHADSQIQEIMKLEELRISGYPPPFQLKTKEVGVKYDISPNPCQMTTAEMGVKYDLSPIPNTKRTAEVGTQYDISDASLEKVGVEKLVSPTTSENISEKEETDRNSAFSISSDTGTQEKIIFLKPGQWVPFPNSASSTKQKPKRKSMETNADHDSDDTCDTFVECGEKGICKCQRMQGREYYEYYERTKEYDYITMYPQGKCSLPRGAVFHFTGAPPTMKREDVKDALVALGAKIEFIDYQSGSKEGWVRLSYKYEARIIIKKMIDKKKLNIAGAELIFRVLSGKDEKRYHKKAIEAIFQLQEKAKGLETKLKKAGYSYVTKYDRDSEYTD